MNDDKLPDLFSSGDEKELSLEEIMAADAKDSAAEDKMIDSQRNKGKAKKAIIIGSGGFLAAAIIAGLIVVNPFGGDLNFGNKDTPNVSSTSAPSKEPLAQFDAKDLVSDDEDFAKDDKRFPIKIEEWQESRSIEQDEAEMRQEILTSLSGSGIASSAGTLPPEAAGYTSDWDKQTNEDGSLNTAYSFWTAETFTAEVGEYTERLINPIFGGWDLYQYSAYPANQFFDVSLISDMFTSEWRTANADKAYSDYVPVLADWAGNDYGMGDVLLTSGTRWIGEITSSTTEFIFDPEQEQYTAITTANIKYTAWAKDQTKLEKTGTLTLNLVPNVNQQNETGHKVLISSASLKVDG